MAVITTIDSAGRVVIPKSTRDALHLHPNTRLRVIEGERRIVLEPLEDEPVLIGGELVGPPLDVRTVREERLDDLSRRSARRRRV